MFVMDSKSAGARNTKKALKFVQVLVNDFEIDRNHIQVGILSDSCKRSSSVKLNRYKSKESLLRGIEDIMLSDFAGQIKKMRSRSFKKKYGGREGVKRIGVIVIDEEMEHPVRSLGEAERAKKQGIELFVINVGNKDPQDEAKLMCSRPVDEHFFQVNSYDDMQDIKWKMSDNLCDGM